MLSVMPDRIASLVDQIDQAGFGEQYFGLCRDVLDIDQCTAFSFVPGEPPRWLVAEAHSRQSSELARTLAVEYVAGAYRDDPCVEVAGTVENSRPIVYSPQPLTMGTDAYRRRFYVEPGLEQELVILGKVDAKMFYLSFYRSNNRSGFSNMEFAQVRNCAGMMVRLLNKHERLTTETRRRKGICDNLAGSDARDTLFRRLVAILLDNHFGLTPREAEVCGGIMLGYTTVGIALNLGIAQNTVATHRKRAYAKLAICSQNELFARYFKLVEHEIGQLSMDARTALN